MTKGPKLVAIYALVDPVTDRPRYVGFTTRKPKIRLTQHVSDAMSKVDFGAGSIPPKERWIRKLAARGMSPRIHVIQRVRMNEEREHESYWTWRLYLEGEPILNFAGPSAVFSKLSKGLRRIVPSFKVKAVST